MIARDPIVRRPRSSRPPATRPRAVARQTPTPRPVHVAAPVAPQARYYSSLGRSVERTANRQRLAGPARTVPARRSGPHGDVQTGGPRQLERAQRYRTSRPYYRTYRQVWTGTPPVQRTIAGQRRGSLLREQAFKIKAKHPRRSEELFTKGELLSQANYNRYDDLMRHGPDILSTEAYRKYAKNLWKRAGHFYPRGIGKRPKLKIGYNDPQAAWAYAWVKPGSRSRRNVVHVQPEIPRMFMGPKGRGGRSPDTGKALLFRGPSESVLLHEWAHTRQSPRTLRNAPKREGGAQAIDKALARKLHIPFQETEDPDYLRWERRAKRKGRKYVFHGQFR